MKDRPQEDRLLRFETYQDKGYYQKTLLSKIKEKDKELIRNFIIENNNLDHEKFEMKLNRFFLDKERPKNWTLILEILSNIN